MRFSALIISLLISGFHCQLHLFDSDDSFDFLPEDNITTCISGGSNTAYGNYRNVILKTELPVAGDNYVNIELIYDINIQAGGLSTLTLPIFKTLFGDMVTTTLEVEVTLLNDLYYVYSEGSVRFTDQGNSIDARICFGETIREDFSVKVTFGVRNMICRMGNQYAMLNSWFGQLTTVETDHVEVDYVLTDEAYSQGFRTVISPGSSRSRGARIDSGGSNALYVFVPYPKSSIKFGTPGSVNIYLLLGSDYFDPAVTRTCVDYSRNFFVLYLIGAIPILSCLCLILLGVSQYINDSRQPRRRGSFMWLTRYNPFITRNDIVLRPDPQNSIQEDTGAVRAVPESQAPGSTAISVGMSHYIEYEPETTL